MATDDLYEKAVKVYSPINGVFAIMNKPYMLQPTTAAQRDAVARAWTTLVFDHKLAYLRHRWHAFRELLGLGHRRGGNIYASLDDGSGVAAGMVPGPIQAKLQALAIRLDDSWLFRPYIYALIGLLLVPLWWRQREVAAVVLSGLLCEAALYFVAPTPDFRYSSSLVISTVLVMVMLVASRARRVRAAGVTRRANGSGWRQPTGSA